MANADGMEIFNTRSNLPQNPACTVFREVAARADLLKEFASSHAALFWNLEVKHIIQVKNINRHGKR